VTSANARPLGTLDDRATIAHAATERHALAQQSLDLIGDVLRRLIKAVCFDFGDTLADETTEVKNAEGVTLRADLCPGVVEVLRELDARGYLLALVADGLVESYRNVLRQHRIEGSFGAISASELAGAEKPSAPVFRAALELLGIDPSEFGRTVMVGNRVDRDVKGSKALGMISVLLTWSRRYRLQPNEAAETPDYVISDLAELPALLDQIELSLRR
jgi:FMN phosphatase YigB (HAD superfamily)